MNDVETMRWDGDVAGHLSMIDQTLLPTELKRIDCRDIATVWEAIKMLRVRGAPAIGIAAAYGVVVGLQSVVGASAEEFSAKIVEVTDYLATSRPTAVNLFWALDRMKAKAAECAAAKNVERLAILLAEAKNDPRRRSSDLPRDRQVRRRTIS